jgi:hypothetical protein
MRLPHLDSGPSRNIQVQNIECEALVASDWDWKIQPIEYFFLSGFVWPHPERNRTEWKRKENSECGI